MGSAALDGALLVVLSIVVLFQMVHAFDAHQLSKFYYRLDNESVLAPDGTPAAVKRNTHNLCNAERWAVRRDYHVVATIFAIFLGMVVI